MSERMREMLRHVYNYGESFRVNSAVQKRTARALARRGWVDLVTHDDEGYECWVMSVTDAGEAALKEGKR